VGIAFSNLGPTHKQQIVQLVEFARWEGTDPSASLARRMFETSAALPPSKVLDALPPTPSGATTQRAMLVAEPARQASLRAGATTQRSMPVAEPPRAPERAGATTQKSMPAADSQRPTSDRARATSQRSMPAADSRPPRSERAGATSQKSMPAVEPPASGTGKPLDATKLRLGMTHLTHKRLEQALKMFQELLQESPGDRQATQWLYTTHARMRLKSDDENGAVQYYQKVLEVDEDNHEARKFVREHHQNKRLGALPFGRYFVKKK
jgi:tetratricopeptide (TPR) repeat protein